jgi:hypothetical protein
MTVDLTHPAVTEYLTRLADAARTLPPGRAEELSAELRAHLAEALTGVGPDDTAAVMQVLDRVGPPEDIVAAELENGSVPGAPSVPGVVLGAGPDPKPAGRGSWGPVEVLAVLLLTVGVITVIGPFIGLVLVWLSKRWTVRDKVIASLVGAVPVLLSLVLILAGLAALGRVPTSSTIPPTRVITVEEGPPQP